MPKSQEHGCKIARPHMEDGFPRRDGATPLRPYCLVWRHGTCCSDDGTMVLTTYRHIVCTTTVQGATNFSKFYTMTTSSQRAVNAVCITGHRISLSQHHLAAAITPAQVEGTDFTMMRTAISTIAKSENIDLIASVQCSSESICTIVDLRSILDDFGTPGMIEIC